MTTNKISDDKEEREFASKAEERRFVATAPERVWIGKGRISGSWEYVAGRPGGRYVEYVRADLARNEQQISSAELRMVECENCAFRYGAEHVKAGSTPEAECPVCELQRLRPPGLPRIPAATGDIEYDPRAIAEEWIESYGKILASEGTALQRDMVTLAQAYLALLSPERPPTPEELAAMPKVEPRTEDHARAAEVLRSNVAPINPAGWDAEISRQSAPEFERIASETRRAAHADITVRSSEGTMAPGAELLVETDRNAEYWRKGAYDCEGPERMLAMEQAVNAWRNAAYAMAARALKETEKAAQSATGTRTESDMALAEIFERHSRGYEDNDAVDVGDMGYLIDAGQCRRIAAFLRGTMDSTTKE